MQSSYLVVGGISSELAGQVSVFGTNQRHLSASTAGRGSQIQDPARPDSPAKMTRILQDQEKEIIESALAESRGKVAGAGGAAAKLGIPPSTLDSKIKKLRIKKDKFRIAV